ncbi:hypothetical protein [Mangrovicoccus algicola]|uniref:Response regulatory domain-containing protein n=1 Tax=Mangrovicoccus algicola TaxID=2771008 RepID=A0A8J6YXL5_9RHOB|nr:hypothetical protein [Mangrovicoccus algicola]MBE3638329.1 hypothetical protein [Mangrovicoccus algicola]
MITEPDSGVAAVLVAFGEAHGWNCAVFSDGDTMTRSLRAAGDPLLLLIDADLFDSRFDVVLGTLAALDRPMRLRFATAVNGANVVAAGLMARARDLSVGPGLMKPFSPEALNLMLVREREELARFG